jgi:enamine deaminase RidA (YjgF/YER057c/UK114 family)
VEHRSAQGRAGAREPGGRLLAIRVRVGLTAEGRLAQLEQVAKKVEACLKVGDASLSDIIETRTYVADPDQLAKYADICKQYFGSASPARTILKEGGLSDPDNLIEVMAFAAIQ